MKTNSKKKEIIFEEANAILAENQEGVNPLPVNINPEIKEAPFTAMFVLTPKQIEQLAANEGRIYVTQLTFGNLYHPINVDLNKPQTLSPMGKKELFDYMQQRQIEQKEAELEQLKQTIRDNQANKTTKKKTVVKKLPIEEKPLVN